jgi:hypothetical protein
MSREIAAPATRSSARLGLTLRAVLIAPKQGFEAAVKAADRRSRAAQKPAEGVMPYVLSALGGAALFMLWLKVGGLLGLRLAPRDSFRYVYLFGAMGIGAVLGLCAQVLWSTVAPWTLRERVPRRNLRLLWGAAALPQVFALLLVPLDLLIVGPETFTTARLEDPLGAAWAAFSIALGAAFAVWAAFLFVRGVATMGRAGLGRVIGASVVAILVLLLLYGPFIVSDRVMT